MLHPPHLQLGLPSSAAILTSSAAEAPQSIPPAARTLSSPRQRGGGGEGVSARQREPAPAPAGPAGHTIGSVFLLSAQGFFLPPL